MYILFFSKMFAEYFCFSNKYFVSYNEETWEMHIGLHIKLSPFLYNFN